MIDLYEYESETPHKELLESWGPSYWKQFREMEANYAFAGWTLDLMAYLYYRVVNNMFITTCDAATLEKYEKLFTITPQKNQNLDERRQAVLTRYIGNQKVSFDMLAQYVSVVAGVETQVFWDPDQDFVIRIRIPPDDEVQISYTIVQKALSSKLPAHIQLYFNQQVALEIMAQEKVSFREIMRIPFSWWEGTRTLDGTYSMDGSIPLNQEVGPDWDNMTIRELMTNEQDDLPMFSIRKSATYVLNGSAKLDGGTTMASGQEIL